MRRLALLFTLLLAAAPAAARPVRVFVVNPHLRLPVSYADFEPWYDKAEGFIGVTGTKGKSTVVELLGSVLEAAGHKVAFLSSVHIKVGRSLERNPTPNSLAAASFAAQRAA